MRVVVWGAGFTGLTAALLLAAEGHQVTLIGRRGPAAATGVRETGGPARDPVADTCVLWPETMAALQAELPTVAAELTARATPLDGGAAAGAVLRLPVAREVLTLAAAEVTGLTLREGDDVTDLLSDGRIPGRPHVRGVLTEGGEAVFADLVVDATGRRSPMPGMLADLGAVRPGGGCRDNGYRCYAARLPAPAPGTGRVPWQLGRGPGAWIASTAPTAGERSVVLCVRDDDEALYPLAGTAAWHRAVFACHPGLLPDGGAGALGDVLTTLVPASTRREYVVAGEPVALGVLGIGTASLSCHPLLALDASMGLAHALVLRDVLGTAGTDDARDLALAFDRACRATVLPVHRWAADVEELSFPADDGPYATADPHAGVAAPGLSGTSTALTHGLERRVRRLRHDDPLDGTSLSRTRLHATLRGPAGTV
ncbi:hypothetical protein [Streptomyces sp. YS415]|uniref:hypothetical protein n=1 Tax=Streptomyces sp. YS415 TaxID=2944806 RepID=UPI0020205428|nr:hypothetical protein [Streptomyces sp. YS415]MCL7429386.1 hypothetical protein [Streptomyces sp. YS415]